MTDVHFAFLPPIDDDDDDEAAAFLPLQEVHRPAPVQVPPAQQQQQQQVIRNETIIQRKQKQSVRVGLCQEDVTFEGLAYRALVPALFPSKQYHVEQIMTHKGIVPAAAAGEASDDVVDVLVCLGYHYPKNLTRQRTRVGDELGRLTPPTVHQKEEDNHPDDDIYWPTKMDLVPHFHRPFQLAFQYEAWDFGRCRYDVLMVATKLFPFGGCPQVYWPYYSHTMFRRNHGNVAPLLTKLTQPPAEDKARAILQQQKTEFAAFVVMKCWDRHYRNNDIMIRVVFFDLLSEAAGSTLPVKSFSACRRTEQSNNGQMLLRPKVDEEGVHDLDPIVELYRPFRFSIVFENNAQPGYVTEKIMNGLLADTIPVYWGAPDIGEHFNVKRMVHCNAIEGSKAVEEFRRLPKPKNMGKAEATIQKGRTMLKQVMQPCIDEVLELERDPDKYAHKLAQPILPGNRLEGSYLDIQRIAKNVRSVMAAYDSPLVSADVAS